MSTKHSVIPFRLKLNNGTLIPSVGFGTYNLPPTQTTELVYQACLKGYRHFDTAVLYENEKEVAAGIAKYIKEQSEAQKSSPESIRKELFYTTKLWNSQCGYSQAKKAIEGCLQKAGPLGYIDLLLIHSPLCGPKKRLETWAAMQEYVDQGKIKNIGVSNFGAKHLDELLGWKDLKYKPVVNQIEISPWLMRQELCDYCKAHDIQVEAYAPLTHGYNIDNPVVTKIAYEKEVTNGQILIRWSMQKGYIPLPKTANVSRLSGNLDVYDFELSDEQMKELDQPGEYQPTDWECTDCP
ncbi:hypothetical protein ACO0RG_004463 [Hanseniaspora osmophila]